MAVVGNFAEVEAALGAILVKVAAADEVVEETGAHTVAEIAARLAPKLTGHLKASTDEHGGQVIADTPYAGYVEYGSRHNKAQPFMRPAKALAEPIVKQEAERLYTLATR